MANLFPIGFVSSPQTGEIGDSINPLKVLNINVDSGNSLELQLGNNDGSSKFSIKDSGGAEVASIDDDGNIAGVGANFSQDVVISGDLTVSGTTTTLNTEVQTADRFLLMNSDYISDAAVNSGIQFVVDPEATSRSVDTGGYASATVVNVDDASGLVAGDIILSRNPNDPANSGLFEVASVDTGATPNTITIKSSPTANLGLLTGFTTDTTVQGDIRKVAVQFLRAKTGGGTEIAYGDNAPALTFVEHGTTAGSTLNAAYEAGNNIQVDTGTPVLLEKGTAVNGDIALKLNDDLSIGFGTGDDAELQYISASNALDLTGNVNVDFTVNTFDLTIDDNTAAAVRILEGSNEYLNVTTTDSSEAMSYGNATTNPTHTFLGTGQFTVGGNADLNAGADVSGGALTFTGTNIDLDPTGTFALDMDASQTATVTIADNLADAFLVQEGANAYLDITTTNTSEAMNFGNATTNPDYNFLGTGQFTVSGNADLNAGADVSGGALTFTGTNIDLDPTGTFALDMDASQTATVTIADNLADAFLIQEGANAYLDITTTDSSEAMNFGNATTNPAYNFLGTGQSTFSGNVDATNGLDVTTAALTAAAGATFSGGEVLVSGGNVQVNDDIKQSFGTNDDASIEYDEDGSDNLVVLSETAASGVVVAKEYTASATGVAAGDVVVMTPTSGEIDKADADTDATSYVIGAALDTATSATVRVAHAGVVSLTFDSAPVAGDRGKPVFLSTTAGQATLTPPSGSADTVIRIGFLVNHTGTLVYLAIGDPVKLAA